MAKAIEVRGLGKQYRLNAQHERADTLRDVLTQTWQRWRGAGRATSNRTGAPAFWALDDVSFTVEAGEVLGVIGRNGAGKSTLLKILARITEPTRGEVDLYGRVGSLLEVGTGFHAELSGRENVYLNGAILGMRRREIQRRFDEIVEFAGVEQFIDTPVKHYSSGMYMRLAFAVAAHLETEILLVDEVLAVGDAEFQKKCLGKMGEVAHAGRTVLFVSHNMNAVEQLCGRVIWLDNGEVQGDSRELRGVIRTYMTAGAVTTTASEWINRRGEFDNPWFKPRRLAVTNVDSMPHQTEISNLTPAFVEIEGDIQELDPTLTIGYAIYTDDGNVLYWSYQTDNSPAHWPRLTQGRTCLRSQIPTRLLNEGSYRVELIGGLYHREWLFEPAKNAPSVEFTIRGGLSDSPHWMAKRPGLLAPVLTWDQLG
ncbi:MAG: ABC transporter ATP-binding protein [Anaerolineales bacterium]|nr:ABC transporter ATP-binding protein [Anaerolineales bacterium]